MDYKSNEDRYLKLIKRIGNKNPFDMSPEEYNNLYTQEEKDFMLKFKTKFVKEL